jgi:polyisoprenoid-binding protein YceI
MKAVVTIIVLILVGLGAFMYFTPEKAGAPSVPEGESGEIMEAPVEKAVEQGFYDVNSELSIVSWSGQKPLVEGYINSGTLAVTGGAIDITEEMSAGSFEIDMNTLSVSETKAKPGQESVLEEHLKGERWFNIEEYPTASFEIISLTPTPSETDPFLFEVTGVLTMKGKS